ncbi:MAG: hypothetical protein GY719_17395 [bacterium]|nr:hypothetical protein [bacterium]
MSTYYEPFGPSEPFSGEVLLRLASDYWVTWTTEILCALSVFVSRRRRVINEALHRRLGAGLSDTSRLWVLPLYVWGLEATFQISRAFNTSVGLVSLPLWAFINWIFEAALALFYLVVLQTLVVFLVDRPSPRLGLTGTRDLAGIAVIISVFWITVMRLWLFQLFNQDRGLPLRLSEIGLPGLG